VEVRTLRAEVVDDTDISKVWNLLNRRRKGMENVTEIDEKLLEILACPKCKGDLALDRERSGLTCLSCHLIYPIRDGIPVMLIEEAEPISD